MCVLKGNIIKESCVIKYVIFKNGVFIERTSRKDMFYPISNSTQNSIYNLLFIPYFKLSLSIIWIRNDRCKNSRSSGIKIPEITFRRSVFVVNS